MYQSIKFIYLSLSDYSFPSSVEYFKITVTVKSKPGSVILGIYRQWITGTGELLPNKQTQVEGLLSTFMVVMTVIRCRNKYRFPV